MFPPSAVVQSAARDMGLQVFMRIPVVSLRGPHSPVYFIAPPWPMACCRVCAPRVSPCGWSPRAVCLHPEGLLFTPGPVLILNAGQGELSWLLCSPCLGTLSLSPLGTHRNTGSHLTATVLRVNDFPRRVLCNSQHLRERVVPRLSPAPCIRHLHPRLSAAVEVPSSCLGQTSYLCLSRPLQESLQVCRPA